MGIFSHVANQKGVALITMMLVSFLVVGLVFMSLTNSMVGKTLTSTHLGSRINMQCAEGNLDIGEAIFLSVFSAAVTESGTSVPSGEVTGSGTVVDENLLNKLILAVPEGTAVTGGTATTSDITINDPNNGNCATGVNVNLVYDMTSSALPGTSAPGADSEYHRSGGGRACNNGSLYDINSITNSALGQSNIRSVYYKCPSSM